jgi:DNA-directed RNA polymerase subunit RPC12/RpoP
MLKFSYQCIKCLNLFSEQYESSLTSGFCPECSKKMTKEVENPASVGSYGRDFNLLQIFEAHGASLEGAAAVCRDVYLLLRSKGLGEALEARPCLFCGGAKKSFGDHFEGCPKFLV